MHGGHTESASDGLPEAWFTQGYTLRGPTFIKKTYHYDNDQEGATLWYHDHALGITRLNVYAGLAGFYLLRDDNENGLIEDNVLPSGDEEIEIVFQDRFFLDDGSLLMPAWCSDPGAAGLLVAEFVECNEGPGVDFPTAIAEFFGDIMVVNGKAWPRLAVDKGKYRLRLLNGSDSRFYILQFRENPADQSLEDALPFWVIGNDNGFLNSPVSASYAGFENTLLVAPGERYDVVIDTSSLGESSFYLRNFGPDAPFGGGVPVFNCTADTCFEPADVSSTGQLMRFDVSNADAPAASVTTGTDLRVDIDDLEPPSATANPRQLALFEGLDEYGRLQPLLGTVAAFPAPYEIYNGSLTWFQRITENPALDATETWELYNATADAHPIHLHLVSFRIIDREPWNIVTTARDQLQHNGQIGEGANINITGGSDGSASDPADYEAGRKDTAIMYPDEVTRVVATFDRPGRYVWHCHILSHEDHEMMRPLCVGDLTEENCGPLGDTIVVPND